ncbi:MAG TPA: FMN-binding negative transcriptional regulator [Quisquiliibacterium sp.]|nr:FMN-binding negative transcriptional regulator [Quisquiliibacterium sp.]HQD84127.1 FMN-binding negative transcriptional regulator [Quisquiliibacterium sp.]
MYLPPHFSEPRLEELHRILREHPLGMLVTHGPAGLDANHIPFELDPERGPHGTLLAHVARANPLCTEFAGGADVMVVFRGVQGYISPNWYPSKHETHRQVPTWNYEVVHAHGRLRLVDDEKFVRGIVARLTRRHEATEPKPWKMGEAPADYLDRMLQAIVGVEIEVVRLEGKRKLSQNREARDVDGAVRALQERGQVPLSDAMSGARR